MPICTSCTTPVPFLYTLYQSANNLRLEQCTSCQKFADPYVEHDNLIVLLDLILLKRDVYRHLIFNLGAEPQRLTEDPQTKRGMLPEGSLNQWGTIVQLGSVLIFIDAFIRFSRLHSLSSPDQRLELGSSAASFGTFLRFFVACFAETVAFHSTTVFISGLFLPLIYWTRCRFHGRQIPNQESGTRKYFKLSHIPLALFYSSLTKLFLLLLLSLWMPSSSPSPNHSSYVGWVKTHNNPMLQSALQIFNDENLDRDWVVRNLLGGMAAGFGLQVVLDCNPVFIALIIIMGWTTKTVAATMLGHWLFSTGVSPGVGESWLAQSIP